MALTFQEYSRNIAQLTARRQDQLIQAWLTFNAEDTHDSLLARDIPQAPPLSTSRRALYIPSSPIPSEDEF